MQELFKWQDRYSINVGTIDSQHEKWLGIMNKLFIIFKNKGSKTEILRILQEMKSYTVFHFGTEERYFAKYNYAEAEKHKQLHKEFIKTLDKFRADYERDSSTLTMEMMAFMQKWLTNHIIKEDVKYANLFASKGL